MGITIDTSHISDYGNYNSTNATEAARTTGTEAYAAGRSGLTAGSTVTGEIIDKNGNEVTIRFGDDQTMSAKLQGDANIEVGMRLTFEVARSSNGQTALRPLFSNLSNSSAAMTALRAAGLPVNNTTLAMTDRMMTESMPVNRNALAEMFRNVSTHQNVSPESIVQMTKLNMPLTESNIIQFDNYRNFEHQIMNDLHSVSDGVADLLKEAIDLVSASGNETQMIGNMPAGEVIGEVLNLIDPEALEAIAPETVNVEMGTEAGAIAETAQTLQTEGAVQTAQAEGTEGTTETAQLVQTSQAESTSGTGQTTQILQNIETAAAAETAQTATETINPNLSLTGAEQQILASDIQNILILAGESQDIHEPLNPSEVMTLVKELTEKYPPEEIRVDETQLKEYSEDQGEIADEGKHLSEARTDIEHLKAAPEAAREGTAVNQQQNIEAGSESVKNEINRKLADLLKSDGFTKLVKDSVKAQMSIKPTDVAKNGKIDELYDRIQKTSAKITELMENIGRTDSSVAKAAGALTDNVNFMNQLNEFVGYVQLPLKMAGEDANGELYVYTNRKNLSNNDGNYSALLHLDMEHLGPMDIYVTMRDHTKVSTNFYLETEELLDFIESHIDELTKRLTDKGYNTSTKVTQRDPGQPITPIADEFTKDEANAQSPVVVSKMRFDVRA